jgi:hypothetical protein
MNTSHAPRNTGQPKRSRLAALIATGATTAGLRASALANPAVANALADGCYKIRGSSGNITTIMCCRTNNHKQVCQFYDPADGHTQVPPGNEQPPSTGERTPVQQPPGNNPGGENPSNGPAGVFHPVNPPSNNPGSGGNNPPGGLQ